MCIFSTERENLLILCTLSVNLRLMGVLIAVLNTWALRFGTCKEVKIMYACSSEEHKSNL